MQDWDRLVMVVIGGGIAVYTGIAGWGLLQKRQKMAAVGAFVLAVATVILPILLAVIGT